MPRRRRLTRPRGATIWLLLVFSAVLLFLPRGWTGRLLNFVQFLAPFQHAATVATDVASDAISSDHSEAVPPDAHASLQKNHEALRHEAASQAIRLAELERQVAVLTATREWNIGGRAIGDTGRLIPSKIVSMDVLPWRSSRLVNAGALQGVRPNAAVTSRHFSLEAGEDSSLRHGMAILHAETLIGFVDQTSTHAARVRLVTDVGVEMKARIGRFTDRGFLPLDRLFWLVGAGSTMRIRDLDRRDVEAGLIQAGDIVLAETIEGVLPVPMTVGKIIRIDPIPSEPLLAAAVVQPSIELDLLRRVYVFDPS